MQQGRIYRVHTQNCILTSLVLYLQRLCIGVLDFESVLHPPRSVGPRHHISFEQALQLTNTLGWHISRHNYHHPHHHRHRPYSRYVDVTKWIPSSTTSDCWIQHQLLFVNKVDLNE